MSVATLGFVLNLVKAIGDAAKQRAEVQEERLKRYDDDLKRTEKWAEREKTALNAEIAKLRSQVAASLSGIGVATTLDAKDAAAHISSEVRESIDARLDDLRKLLLVSDKGSVEPISDSRLSLEIGRGYMATGQWALAASYLDSYVSVQPADWQAHFVRGVAYANLRGGRKSDMAALRAYNDAIAFALEPSGDADQVFQSRLFIYRGAILKRLSRLDESQKDLQLGLSRASLPYEMADATYNLACVYAMRGAKVELLETLANARTLENRHYVIRSIRAHLGDYFSSFASDQDFLNAVASLV